MRRFAIPLFVLAATAAVSTVGPITDNFDRADSGTLGANWTLQTTQPIGIGSNQAVAGQVDFQCDYRNTDTFAATMYAQVKVITASAAGGDFVGVSIHNSMDATSATYDNYTLWTDSTGGSGHFFIDEHTNGTQDIIGHYSETVSSGDTIKLARLAGNVLQAYLNGTPIACDGGTSCSGGVVTDGTFTGGNPGLCIFDDGVAEDWEASDIATTQRRHVTQGPRR